MKITLGHGAKEGRGQGVSAFHRSTDRASISASISVI